MKGIFTAIIVIFNFLTMDAQSKLDNAIMNLEENYSQEKVYILFDKDQYVAGDQMLFQSFIFDGYNLSSISKTLYVELYDQSKNLIDKKTLLINNGKASGLFELSKTLNEDVYFVRAYTNWMANFDTEWNFIKPIPIYNSTSKKKLVPSVTSKWSIEAFPECGTFIDKTSTKIAVRINHQGKPAKKWSGYLIDSELPDNKIVSFQSLDENIAIFQMTPQFGKTYKVVVEDGEGNSQISTLPTVTDKGINLKITSDKSSIKYTINAVKLENSVQNYSVVGTINNQLAYKAKIKSNNSQVTSVIPIKEIKQNGILQISIFDDRENLVAQRLCFLNHSDLTENTIAIQNSNFNNQPRTLNSFDINENPNSGNYTVLVKDVTDIGSSQDDILSNLFLTQDLKDPIKNPTQYFTKTANLEALDALLISEKWKRFDWTKLLAGQKPLIKYNLTDNEFISYTARLALNSRPLPDTLVNLVFKTDDGESAWSQFTTDSNGEITINNLSSEDPYLINFYLNSNDEIPANLTLNFKKVIDNKIIGDHFPKTNYILKEIADGYSAPETVQKAIINMKNRQKMISDETLIEEIKLTKTLIDKKNKLNQELSGKGKFFTGNATVFDLVNDNKAAQFSPNILQWLQNRAPGLSFSVNSEGNLVPYIRGKQAALLLDEIPTDPSMITSIPVSTIAMVKIFNSNVLVGSAVLIYTRTGNMLQPSIKGTQNDNKIEIQAYDKQTTDFQTVNYSQEKYRSSISDWRQVLYWNPEFTNTTVNFYNNDNAKNREITIIGFDKESKLLYYNQTIK